MTPSGIEPATFRFVAQHLNHCATVRSPISCYVHVNELHLLLSTVRLMCGINCTNDSIYFYRDKIRATSFSGNADSCAFGTVLADGNY